jgi:hypothetical protein
MKGPPSGVYFNAFTGFSKAPIAPSKELPCRIISEKLAIPDVAAKHRIRGVASLLSNFPQ